MFDIYLNFIVNNKYNDKYMIKYIVIPPVEITHSDWIIAMIYFLMSPSKLMSHVTCHMTPMAHGHGARGSLHI